MKEVNEPINAELQPATWTLSSGGVFFFVTLVALLSVLGISATSGVSVHHLLGAGFFTAGVGVFVRIYKSAHRPAPTEAWFEENRLVVRDPNPWWKRLTDPYFGWELQLIIQAVAWNGDDLVVTGSPGWPVSWGRTFKVRLKPNEKQAPVLRVRLPDIVRR